MNITNFPKVGQTVIDGDTMIIRRTAFGECIMTIRSTSGTIAEIDAYRNNITEAMGIANETGLSPRELLDQLEVAKKTLKDILELDKSRGYESDQGFIANKGLKTIDK